MTDQRPSAATACLARQGVTAPFVSAGPVQLAASALLPDALAVRCVPKSPLGPRALRVEGDVDATWLRGLPWVARVVPQQSGAFVEVTTAALYEWVVAALTDGSEPGAGTEGSGMTLDVRHGPPEEPPRLRDVRDAATAEAVRRLLGARGFAIGTGGEVEVVVTGSVDVPNGPLRARHGGFVYPGDLVAEIAPRLRLDDTTASALLRFALLRHDRSSSVVLDEQALYGAAAATFLTLTRDCAAAEGPLQESRALRALLVHLDLMPSVVARSATGREPALLTRYLDTLADRMRATRQRPAALDRAVRVVAGRGMHLAGLAGPGTDS
jgi:hypothetical protein